MYLFGKSSKHCFHSKRTICTEAYQGFAYEI